MKELLTKIYVKLIGRRREYYSTAIEYKGSAYVITARNITLKKILYNHFTRTLQRPVRRVYDQKSNKNYTRRQVVTTYI